MGCIITLHIMLHYTTTTTIIYIELSYLITVKFNIIKQ